jgi:hypothetical protein
MTFPAQDRAGPQSAEAGANMGGRTQDWRRAKRQVPANLRVGTMSTSEGVQKRNCLCRFCRISHRGTSSFSESCPRDCSPGRAGRHRAFVKLAESGAGEPELGQSSTSTARLNASHGPWNSQTNSAIISQPIICIRWMYMPAPAKPRLRMVSGSDGFVPVEIANEHSAAALPGSVRANTNANGGDGLLQRFGLLAWPDTCPEWKDMDRHPHGRAREDAWEVFERLSKLDRRGAIAMGARRGPSDSVPFFRLGAAAHDEFLSWRSDLERRLRTGKMAPALEAHLAKYRKLVPALALINHLVDNGHNEISQQAMRKALAFSKYLETHARRLYGATNEPERAAAQAILTKIREGELQDGFTVRTEGRELR